MALSVDPATLTPSRMTSLRSTLISRQLAATALARQRNQLAALRARNRNNPAMLHQIANSLAINARRLAPAQRDYQSSRSGYTSFEKAYNRLGTLGRAAPDLQSTLNRLVPYDPTAAADRLGAQSQLNQSLIASKQGRDELSQDFSKGQRLLNEEQPERFRRILSGFAGRGMARSTGYASAFGQETADFSQRLAELQQQNQRGQAQYSLADAGAQQDYLSQLAGILSGTTGRLVENAGQLGMAGNTDLPLLLELARRRLAASGG